MKRLNTLNPGFENDFASLMADRSSEERSVAEPVRAILADVRTRGDEALCDYTARFDRLTLSADKLRISAEEITREADRVPADLMDALKTAARRIEAFHAAQMPKDLDFTDDEGIRLGMRWTALDAVGLYVPGGKAAYPSSVLMNALPARVAGVQRVAMCVPSPDGVLNPLVLAAARLCGVEEIYRIGGAHAVGAMAYGTERIAPVDRIVGPGNAFVAEAKRQVFGHVGIDSIAGPSEVVVVADGNNDPRLAAIDLLAQAEHDEQAQAILITTDAAFGDAVNQAVLTELQTLPRTAIAAKSWADHGAIIVVKDLEEAARIVNQLAPEHLEVLLDEPRAFSGLVRHAGAIFMGRYCPEAVGDYVGGPNHVLPTSRTARFASGLSVFDFIKRTTTIEANEAGLKKIGPAGVALAQAEGLDAHALSLSLRLDQL
ncbi:histidinol dehydrogenase [Gluconobacter thailandicus F149-1 = NBRC 100600]|uniref:Histidinol dehydrogenase n=1 Tax=Gluconobacter thailandicus NBRC 3257 TaxID=1381097 RepID=A0ABQ0IVS6_GLUTH|nr:histidinol dehydrogenase [Gluconobacter thailandicus]KXV53438.1 histidinol dehydrogenase [Gluconobacter thailandicus]GAC87717.1 histidinol dehydrogenase [Gluconobacter thailandicus NBRC 3255]GAD26295.1 histidinol dehydrogenase [Gluconobacter thailandicus NBRC 3257]GAN92841.1 histidinol dehydrogenase [Gluconobacter thailandicus F149-1 = NBRC 100600]GBR61441.1 histidinol dehydrogenase [Gluconobacter thailandicus F149-1 = NBRC 100600]